MVIIINNIIIGKKFCCLYVSHLGGCTSKREIGLSTFHEVNGKPWYIFVLDSSSNEIFFLHVVPWFP